MYRTIETSTWSKPDFKALSTDAKLIFMYYRTNPQTHLSGIYYIPLPTVEFETGMSITKIKRSMQELFDGKYIKYDESNSVVWVIDMLRENKAKGEKVLKAVAKQLSDSDSYLNKEFIDYYDTLSIPYRYPIDRLTVTVPVTVTESVTESAPKKSIILSPEEQSFYNRFDDYVLDTMQRRMKSVETQKGDLQVILRNRKIKDRLVTIAQLDEILEFVKGDSYWRGNNMQTFSALKGKTNSGIERVEFLWHKAQSPQRPEPKRHTQPCPKGIKPG